jgi:hypothetical protein
MEKSRDESDIERVTGGAGKESDRDRGVPFHRFLFRPFANPAMDMP